MAPADGIRGKREGVTGRTRPAKGFATRERHRIALTAHAFVMIAGLLACAVANRMLTPDRFWVQWIALAWGAAFGFHLWVFSRGAVLHPRGDRLQGPAQDVIGPRFRPSEAGVRGALETA